MPIINADEVRRDMDDFIKEAIVDMRTKIIYNLTYVGVKCINKARSSGSYKDQTGNLRSSVGFVIVEDGRIIHLDGFTGKGSNGKNTGKSLAQKLAGENTKGLVLIAVAGMEYASYVSARGFDVLDSAELLAEKLVPSMLKELGFK